MQKLIILITLLTALNLDSFGQTFFEVDSIQDADIKIYYEEDESKCDIKVCFVYTAEEAKEEAHWCEVGDPGSADIKIIFVDIPSQADLKLCVVFDPKEAKWINQEIRKKFHL